MTEPVEARLARLAEPRAPSALAPNVMARIARLPVTDPVTAGQPGRKPARRSEWRLGAAWASIGILLVIGVVVQRWIATGSIFDLISPRIVAGGLGLMPVEGWTSLVLCAGLVLYLRGLFAPLRRGRI